MKKAWKLLFVFLVCIPVPENAWGQAWAAGIKLSPDSVISIITIYPGEALYSMYGHTAIRIVDPVSDLDILYNYGQASVPFDASFVPRFVTGDLPFILGVTESSRAFLYYEKYEDRSIYEQVLDLSLEQRQAVFDYLVNNAREENRTYIYDFFFDNCTTRVRDLLEHVFGPELDLPTEPWTGGSYRKDISPYLEGIPFVKLGINLVLGVHTDEAVTGENALYLPLQLMKAVEDAWLAGKAAGGRAGGAAGAAGKTVSGADEENPSGRKNFVQSSRFLYTQERSAPHPPLLGPGTVMWLLFLFAAALTLFGRQMPRLGNIFDFTIFFIVGLIGLTIALLWIFSGYEMTTGNINILWAWPTHAAAAFIFLKLDSDGRILRRIRILYLEAAIVSAAGTLAASLLLTQNLPVAAIPVILSIILRGSVRALYEKKVSYERTY